MSKLNLDRDRVLACRELARKIAERVHRDVGKLTSRAIERASLRFIGLEDALDGKPVANAIVEAIPSEHLSKGALYWFGRALASQRTTPIALALRIAGGTVSLLDTPDVPLGEIERTLAPLVQRGLERLSTYRRQREQAARWPQYSRPLKYVEIGTGDIDQDIEQALAAARAGAGCIAIQRVAGQSLMEYVPSGETHHSSEGTYATQANFRKLRRALDQLARERSMPVKIAHSSSGLCMPELALIGSLEGVDYLLNDAFYAVLFRDVNVRRAFTDQAFARLVLAHSGIVINTGENYFVAHAESYRIFPQVLSSHFLNEQFSFLAELAEWQMGFSHAFEIDPELEDGLLYELAQAQVVRECFPKAPIKYLPPTRHKTGDIFYSHVMDALFTLVGAMTHQDLQQLGMATEAIHHPLLMDRYWSLKAANYVLKNARSLGDEIQWLMNGKVVRRARSVLDAAHRLLQKIDKAGGLFRAVSSGYFSNIPRHVEEGIGRDGLIERGSDYYNPVWERLLEVRSRDEMVPAPASVAGRSSPRERHVPARRPPGGPRRGRRSDRYQRGRSQRGNRFRSRAPGAEERPAEASKAVTEPAEFLEEPPAPAAATPEEGGTNRSGNG